MELEKENIKSESLSSDPLKILDILFANKKIDEYIELVQDILLKKQINKELIGSQKFKLHLQKCQKLKKIQKKLNEQQKKLDQSFQGYNVNKINNKSKMGVKVTNTNIQIKYQGILEANIQNLCIMFYLTNLYKEWAPFCKESIDICKVSPLEKVAFMKFKLPFLAQRHAYFYGMGIDRINKNGKIFIYGQGITHNQQFLAGFTSKKYESKGSVQLDLKFFICEITCAGKGQYLFRSYSQMDSHMPKLPETIVNYIIKQMGGFLFEKIVKQANNFEKTPWEKQIKMNYEENKNFYEWLHIRIQDWKKQQEQKKAKI